MAKEAFHMEDDTASTALRPDDDAIDILTTVELVRRMEMKARTANGHNHHGSNGRSKLAPLGRGKFVDLTEGKEPLILTPRSEPPRSELFQQNATLREENTKLSSEVKRLQSLHTAGAVEAIAAELTPTNNNHHTVPMPDKPLDSEGRLRLALTKKGTTTSELKSAILAVESLVEEARRELANAMLRERRAAFEGLHNAIDRGDEDVLEMAIEKARLADVEVEDIAKGEAKLADLRAMSPEQRAKKLAREMESKGKKEAFILIKRDDADGLKDLLMERMKDVRWQDWKDYAGRSLWRCALDLRATRVQSYLAPLVGQKLPEGHPSIATKRRSVLSIEGTSDENRPSTESPSGGITGRQSLTSSGSAGHGAHRGSLFGSGIRPGTGSFHSGGFDGLGMERKPSSGSDGKLGGDSPAMKPKSPKNGPEDPPMENLVLNDGPLPSPAVRNLLPAETDDQPSPERDEGQTVGREFSEGYTVSPTRSECEYATLKVTAFRAVAQDDSDALIEVLVAVHQDIWTKWENKAGKDLLTLSTERGSSEAYSMLARELGILKEVVRETFEERESVWVFEAGEVMPRRATVIEDTSEGEDEVLLEFWDGDEPATHVERCLIHKMAS